MVTEAASSIARQAATASMTRVTEACAGGAGAAGQPELTPAQQAKLDAAGDLVKKLKEGGKKPGDADFDAALAALKATKEELGIKELSKAEKKKLEKEAKAKAKA